MAALLGAHTSSRGVSFFSLSLAVESATLAVETKAPASPQIVLVLPVPGGLNQAVVYSECMRRINADKSYPCIRENPGVLKADKIAFA